MNKSASRFLKHSNIAPSHVGLGASPRQAANRNIETFRTIRTVETQLIRCGCSIKVVEMYWGLVRKGKRLDLAAEFALRKEMPELYRKIMAVPKALATWTFGKRLKEYAKQSKQVEFLKQKSDR